MIDKDEIASEVKQIHDERIPQIYANGFNCMLSHSDILTVLTVNGKAQYALNMSYTVAKTLAVALGSAISQLEERTGRVMLTTQEVDQVLGIKVPISSGKKVKKLVRKNHENR